MKTSPQRIIIGFSVLSAIASAGAAAIARGSARHSTQLVARQRAAVVMAVAAGNQAATSATDAETYAAAAYLERRNTEGLSGAAAGAAGVATSAARAAEGRAAAAFAARRGAEAASARVRTLADRLDELQMEPPVPGRGVTRAGIPEVLAGAPGIDGR